MKKIFSFSLKLLISLLLIILFLEVGLRIIPNIIPPKVLINFEPRLREKVAKGWLPTYGDTIILNRDDSGPPLRIWKPFIKHTHYDADVPGDAFTVETDEIGFCNPRGIYNREPKIDIITIGDSFTWCNAVSPQDTWTKRLSDLTGLSTYNLGKGNLGLYEYIQILKGFGINKHPKFVILNVYEGNDIGDAITYFQTKNKDSDENIDSSKSRLEQSLLENPIGRHSYSFNLIRAYIKYLYNKIVRYSFNKDVNFRYSIVFPDKSISFNLENTDKDEVFNAKQIIANNIEFNVFNNALESFVKLSRQHNFIPVVAYTPSAHTVYDSYAIFDDPTLKDTLKSFSYLQREYFKMKGEEMGYIFIDLTSSLQSAASSSKSQNLLYYRTNLHLTRYGNEIIAKTLSESIKNLGLLK